MDVFVQLLYYMVCGRIKGTLILACVWHEERFYTAVSVPRNGADGSADGKLWVSML